MSSRGDAVETFATKIAPARACSRSGGGALVIVGA